MGVALLILSHFFKYPKQMKLLVIGYLKMGGGGEGV